MALARARATNRASQWQGALSALAAAAVGLLLLFGQDVADLVDIWWNSTTYGHCLFVVPIVAWLIWQRRREVAALSPVAWWPGLLVVAAGGFAWLVGEAAAVALFRHAGLVVMLQGAAIAILGPNVARGLAFPIGYLLFLVPFGDSMEPPLQAVTTDMTMMLLGWAGVPASVDGVLITIPNGWFEVAEACSGAKFVIAMIAYGVLVANVCYVSWARRAAFMAMAVVVPILANGLRAFGTIYAAHLTSVEAATGFDHIVYGWVFFGATMAAVLAAGWRWFDRDPDAAWFDPARLQGVPAGRIGTVAGAGGTFAIAAAFALWGAAIDARVDPIAPAATLPQVPGWRAVPITGEPWVPHYPGADRFLIGRYADATGRRVDVVVAVYASQGEGHELVGFGQGAIRENDRWVRIADTSPIDGGRAIRMAAGPVERETATWYRIGDTVTGSARRVKAETLKAKLLGGRQAGAAILMSAEGRDARGAITAFLRAAGPVASLADHAIGTAR